MKLFFKKEKKLFPFFDWKGMCSGNLDKDAFAIRLFVEDKHELFVAQTFGKAMSLYSKLNNQ